MIMIAEVIDLHCVQYLYKLYPILQFFFNSVKHNEIQEHNTDYNSTSNVDSSLKDNWWLEAVNFAEQVEEKALDFGVLVADIKIGYEDIVNTKVDFNGQPVKNLKSLANMVENCDAEFLKFDLEYQQISPLLASSSQIRIYSLILFSKVYYLCRLWSPFRQRQRKQRR